MTKRNELAGKRVELVRCNDEHTRLEPGLQGTVISVDDADTVHVRWDNGSTLGLCRDAGDRWVVLD
jgi:hypothetical protein